MKIEGDASSLPVQLNYECECDGVSVSMSGGR
jgi:hypothetical protein